jgi:transcriptional regulator with XRE-family HTH domain
MQNRQNEILRQKIIALKRQGKSQQEIARELGIGTITVYRYLKRMGMTKARLSNGRVVKLLLLNEPRLTYQEIAAKVGCCKNAVRAIAKKNGIRRNIGVPDGIRAALTDDILHRRLHALSLARKYRVPYDATLKFVKQTLGCAGLRPGCPKQPLESFFPQRWPELFAAKPAPDRYVLALEEYFNRFCNGRLTKPENYAALIAKFLQFVPDYLQSEFGFGFAAGLDCLRRQKNLRWAN